MNCSADRDKRKSIVGKSGQLAALSAISALVGTALLCVDARAAVPLPQARPAAAGLPQAVPPPSPQAAPAQGTPERVPDTSEPPAAASACLQALGSGIAVARSLPPIRDAGGCGGEDIVQLEAVLLTDKIRVPLKPAAVIRCEMARAIVDWVRVDVDAIAKGLGTRVSGLDNFNSYECRGRNRQAGAKLSEHGRANALDLRNVNLANGSLIALTDSGSPAPAREAVKASICARFMTVLGPGSDGYHEDHIHFDLAPRRNNYKICNWVIEDGLPQIARVLPRPRPPDAPVALVDARPTPPLLNDPTPPPVQADAAATPPPAAAGARSGQGASPVAVATAKRTVAAARPYRQQGRIIAPPPLQLVPTIAPAKPKRGTKKGAG